MSSLQLTLLASQNGELVCRLDKRNQNYSNHKSSLFKPLIISEQIVWPWTHTSFCSYVCHVLLSSMLHEFLWVRKLLMYNILPLEVLFYLGTNSWLQEKQLINNMQSWQFCLLSVQLSCKATRRIMVHSLTALTQVFTAFFSLLPNKPPTKQATHWYSVIKSESKLKLKLKHTFYRKYLFRVIAFFLQFLK